MTATTRTIPGSLTVVFEVGYSETQEALNYNAARLLFGSRGCIKLVKENEITYVGVDVWRMTYEVDEDKVKEIERDVILTKENKPASPRTLSWFFSFSTKVEDTLFQLKAKPLHYQVSHLMVSIHSKPL